jgi:DNA polymerase I
MAGKRILLVDADVVAYMCASAAEVAVGDEEGYWTWQCDIYEVQASIDAHIAHLREQLNADEVKLCLTDSAQNFRKTVLPTYKSNRASVKKPVALRPIRDWLIQERNAYLRPNLEGDDVMGILSTWPKLKGEKIIVSIDKDMKTIPGLYYRDAATGIVEITEADANYWHLYQTLIGDQTDGYKGCPGVGPKKAEAILNGIKADVAVNGGDFVRIAWATVVETYEKAGLTEDDALQQARVARILRASDYDFSNKRPILWTPH